jgi:alkyl sulfatase BDS1-like metallo-beta-lactamase superfamily hydrolase
MTEPRKDASHMTVRSNQEMAQSLNWDDQQSFEDASKGFIATWDPLTITDADDKVIWDLVP